MPLEATTLGETTTIPRLDKRRANEDLSFYPDRLPLTASADPAPAATGTISGLPGLLSDRSDLQGRDRQPFGGAAIRHFFTYHSRAPSPPFWLLHGSLAHTDLAGARNQMMTSSTQRLACDAGWWRHASCSCMSCMHRIKSLMQNLAHRVNAASAPSTIAAMQRQTVVWIDMTGFMAMQAREVAHNPAARTECRCRMHSRPSARRKNNHIRSTIKRPTTKEMYPPNATACCDTAVTTSASTYARTTVARGTRGTGRRDDELAVRRRSAFILQKWRRGSRTD